MAKSRPEFAHLNLTQVRRIAESSLTTRQLAIHYGVPERVIWRARMHRSDLAARK